MSGPSLGVGGAAAAALAARLVVAGLIVPPVMVVELFPAALAAPASGVTNAASLAGVMVLPILLGKVIDLTGSFAAAFVLVAVADGLAILRGALMHEVSRRQPDGTWLFVIDNPFGLQ